MPLPVLYLAGPMSGYPESNYPAFNQAAVELEAVGYFVENPASNEPITEQPTWLDFMRMSLRQIAVTDAIAVLPGWQESKGARIEVDLAQKLGLVVATVDSWIAEAKHYAVKS